MSDRPNAADVLGSHQPLADRWCDCGWRGPNHARHQVAELIVAAGNKPTQPVTILPDGTLDKLTADEWALIEHARAHPDDMVVRRPDGGVTVAEPMLGWSSPLWRIPGAES